MFFVFFGNVTCPLFQWNLIDFYEAFESKVNIFISRTMWKWSQYALGQLMKFRTYQVVLSFWKTALNPKVVFFFPPENLVSKVFFKESKNSAEYL